VLFRHLRHLDTGGTEAASSKEFLHYFANFFTLPAWS
jgi:hypothetical protein